MRKLLSILVVLTIASFGTSNLISCDANPINGGGGGSTPLPPQPAVKNIKYYQDLLKNTNTTITQFNAGIQELKKYKKTINNYQKVLAELMAEEDSYKAVSQDCNYNILLLQNNNLNPDQLLLVKKYLTTELLDLTSELTTKVTYHNDYPSTEITQIKENIKLVSKELAKYT